MIPTPYPDDPTIGNDAILWRRIHPFWIVADDNTGSLRVSSAAFDNSPDGTPTSVHLETVATAHGISADVILESFPGYCMAALSAGDARLVHQAVLRAPRNNDPSHGFIAGEKTKRVKKSLARVCVWVGTPPSAGPRAGS
jgi:hypothetical protein